MIDQVLAGDCLQVLPTVPDGLASLIFTSPPYNVGMAYGAGGNGARDGELTFAEWLAWLGKVWTECARTLRPGGHLVVNVPQGVGRSGDNPYQPVASAVALGLHGLRGCRVVGEVVWNKGATRNSSTAWGSWRSPSSPSIRDCHEMVVIARKDGGPLRPREEDAKPDVSKAEFLASTLSVWTGLGTVANEDGGRHHNTRWHPAPFPVRLAERVVRFLSYPGDVVLDPFVGSGTTGVAARALGRHWLGVELNPEWAARAQRRILHAGLQLSLGGDIGGPPEVRG